MNDRPNLYKNVHKGVRSMLLDLVAASGRVEWTDAAEVAEFRSATHAIFGLLDTHAEAENTFFAQLLQESAPRVATIIGSAHEDQEAELPAILSELEAFDPTAANAAAKGHAIVLRLSRLVAENLAHMADEEELAMPALQAAFDDALLHDVERRLIGSIPPPKMAQFLRRMLPSINASERAEMLGGMKLAGPQIFAAGMSIAAEALTPQQYAALEQSLNAERAA